MQGNGRTRAGGKGITRCPALSVLSCPDRAAVTGGEAQEEPGGVGLGREGTACARVAGRACRCVRRAPRKRECCSRCGAGEGERACPSNHKTDTPCSPHPHHCLSPTVVSSYRKGEYLYRKVVIGQRPLLIFSCQMWGYGIVLNLVQKANGGESSL